GLEIARAEAVDLDAVRPEVDGHPLGQHLHRALAAAYGAMPGRPSSLCTEQMLMILPRRRAIMWRATACPTKNMLSRLGRMISRDGASGNSSNGARRCTPALLTRMSTAPSSCSMCATAAVVASADVTSNGTACTEKPSPRNAAAACSSLRSSRPLSTTVAPA